MTYESNLYSQHTIKHIIIGSITYYTVNQGFTVLDLVHSLFCFVSRKQEQKIPADEAPVEEAELTDIVTENPYATVDE